MSTTPVAVTWKPDPALRAGLRLTIPATPTPRRDRSLDAWADRVATSIKPDARDERSARAVGRDFGDGYVCVATDGHSAVCRYSPDADNPIGKPVASIAGMARVDLPPAFDLVLRRARAVLIGRKPYRPVVVTIAGGRLTVSAEWRDVASSTEHVDVTAEADTRFVIDVDRFLAPFGRPLSLYYRADRPEIILSPTDDPAWRYLVALMRE